MYSVILIQIAFIATLLKCLIIYSREHIQKLKWKFGVKWGKMQQWEEIICLTQPQFLRLSCFPEAFEQCSETCRVALGFTCVGP